MTGETTPDPGTVPPEALLHPAQAEAVAVARQLTDAPELQALFLGGSLGAGTGDGFSDVDLVGVAHPEYHEQIVNLWHRLLSDRWTLIHWAETRWRGFLVNAITEDWLRIDLFLVPPDALGRRAQDMVRPLIDRTGLYDSLPATLPRAEPDPARLKRTITEFIRVVGLLPVGYGRQEWLVLMKGIGLLRDMVAEVMLEDCPLPDRGGILHLSRLLPPEDIAVLEALPAPGPDPEALLAANAEIAEVFFARARPLAERLGVDWPEAFEAATLAHVARATGLKIAPSRAA